MLASACHPPSQPALYNQPLFRAYHPLNRMCYSYCLQPWQPPSVLYVLARHLDADSLRAIRTIGTAVQRGQESAAAPAPLPEAGVSSSAAAAAGAAAAAAAGASAGGTSGAASGGIPQLVGSEARRAANDAVRAIRVSFSVTATTVT